MRTDRQQALHQRLDAARDQLEAELGKGVARDKGLVRSYELLIAGLEDELKKYSFAGGTLKLRLDWSIQLLLSRHDILDTCRVQSTQFYIPTLDWLFADAIVNMPAEQEVAVRIEDGSTYTVILFNGRLDVKAFKERLADEGLILKALNGAVPAYDSTGLSRTLFSGDIKGDTQAKQGKDANNVPYKHVLYAPQYCSDK